MFSVRPAVFSAVERGWREEEVDPPGLGGVARARPRRRLEEEEDEEEEEEEEEEDDEDGEGGEEGEVEWGETDEEEWKRLLGGP